MIRPRLNINTYIKDGFEHVCDIEYNGDIWNYFNQKRYMYDHHTSWVYAITSDDTIKKIGESGHPLGIRSGGTQPKADTDNRLGRYIKGDKTDARIRAELRKDILAGKKVSIWAKKCPMVKTEITIDGMKVTVNSTVHKELEKEYLDYIKRGNAGKYPDLNKGRA